VAVSNSRLQYIKDNQKVNLLYNDYKNQKPGEAAPKLIKVLHPLTAINQILQHVLPPYFQKSRRYGLHHASSKLNSAIPLAFKRNSRCIRTVFEIITELLKINPNKCTLCQSTSFISYEFKADYAYKYTFLSHESNIRSALNSKNETKSTIS
jgi:hypothetical protein